MPDTLAVAEVFMTLLFVDGTAAATAATGSGIHCMCLPGSLFSSSVKSNMTISLVNTPEESEVKLTKERQANKARFGVLSNQRAAMSWDEWDEWDWWVNGWLLWPCAWAHAWVT